MERGGHLPTPDTSTDASSTSLSTSCDAVTRSLRGHRSPHNALPSRSIPGQGREKFTYALMGLRRWRGYKRCVVIGMPLWTVYLSPRSVLFRVSPQQRLQPTPRRGRLPPTRWWRRNFSDASDSSPPSRPRPFPHLSAQARRTATQIPLCESAYEQATEPTRSTPACSSLRVRLRGPA